MAFDRLFGEKLTFSTKFVPLQIIKTSKILYITHYQNNERNKKHHI